MESEDNSEILWEVQKLKERFEEISERFDQQQTSMDKFAERVSELNDTMKHLVSVFDRAEKTVSGGKGNPQLNAILSQNKETTRALLNVSSLLSEMNDNLKKPVVTSPPPSFGDPSPPPVFEDHSPSPPPSSPPASKESFVDDPVPGAPPPSPGAPSLDEVPPPPSKSGGFFKKK